MLQSNLSIGLRRFSLMRMGVGVFRGESAKAMVKPGWPERGLIFYRKDQIGGLAIPARPRFISGTKPSLALSHGIAELSSLEAFLAAVYMASNWELDVHVTGREMPALDGSALPWLKALQQADLFRKGLPPTVLALREKVEASGPGWSALLEPCDTPSLSMTLDLDRPGVGKQEFEIRLVQDDLLKGLAPARVFGFHIQEEQEETEEDDLFFDDDEEEKQRVVLNEFDHPLKVDLARSLVFDKEGKVENEGGLRFPDEPVRYRALTLIGALALLGAPLLAKITCHNTHHTSHKHILRALEADGGLERIPSGQ